MICIHRTINRFVRSVANQRVIKIFPTVKRGWNVWYLRESGEEIRTAFRTQTATQAVRELEKT